MKALFARRRQLVCWAYEEAQMLAKSPEFTGEALDRQLAIVKELQIRLDEINRLESLWEHMKKERTKHDL